MQGFFDFHNVLVMQVEICHVSCFFGSLFSVIESAVFLLFVSFFFFREIKFNCLVSRDFRVDSQYVSEKCPSNLQDFVEWKWAFLEFFVLRIISDIRKVKCAYNLFPMKCI